MRQFECLTISDIVLLLLINNIVKGNCCYMKEIYELILKIKHFCHCNETKIGSYCQISQAELKGIKAMEREEVISCSDFSRKVALSPSRSSRIIDNLVKKGLLSRKISENDRRTTLIYLTRKGWTLKEDICQEERKFEQLLASELKSEDINTIRKGLKLLEKIMGNHI